MRESIKKLRLLLKPRFLIPLALFVLFLLFAGIFATTQETDDALGEEDLAPEEQIFDIDETGGSEEGPLPEWIPPGPPRWFRSNAGGMTLEEIPSRLSALRNKYALVIDYVPPHEVEPRLLPYLHDDFTIEIRVLYEQGEELRRQWLFRDDTGTVRLNAVFKPPSEEQGAGQSPDNYQSNDEPNAEETAEEAIIDEEIFNDEADEAVVLVDESPDEAPQEEPGEADRLAQEYPGDVFADADTEEPSTLDAEPADDAGVSIGFIEIFNEKNQIIEDIRLYADDSATRVAYFYNNNTLVSAEGYKQPPGLSPNGGPKGYQKMYTDSYRYNRSYALRHVERLYHRDASGGSSAVMEPVRLVFPNRVLEEASKKDFMSDTLSLNSDFFGDSAVGEGFRMVYDTDSRGRILTQTLFDSKDETVWVIKNTWSGDRIIASAKTEGENEKRTEYEYDAAGNRAVMRDISNGLLERVVYTQGDNETEELYINGNMVMKAYWENGRKISEERVKR